jgi:predicted DNA-binding protein (UPF0251 family)
MIHETIGLTQDEQHLIDTAITSPTKTEAAKALGISRATLYRHLREPHIKAAYEDVRRAKIEDATGALQHEAEAAVSILATIAADPGIPAHVRVTAAGKILDLALQAYELDGLAVRIEQLEQEQQYA